MGDRLEERKDFSADVAVKLPEATKLAEVRIRIAFAVAVM